MRHNSASELTKPAKNVQMPQTSPRGPTTKRATTQAATLKTFDIQMPFLAMLRSWPITSVVPERRLVETLRTAGGKTSDGGVVE